MVVYSVRGYVFFWNPARFIKNFGTLDVVAVVAVVGAEEVPVVVVSIGVGVSSRPRRAME